MNTFRLDTNLGDADYTLPLMEFRHTKQQINWSGVKLRQPDWGSTSHSLAGILRSS